jgi:hypothetical protein
MSADDDADDDIVLRGAADEGRMVDDAGRDDDLLVMFLAVELSKPSHSPVLATSSSSSPLNTNPSPS